VFVSFRKTCVIGQKVDLSGIETSPGNEARQQPFCHTCIRVLFSNVIKITE
jgi:hypothetical protein